tara:strand:+ start:577 stop:771 length:195 start_codon:yes stop_codon:yes gene_type:complete
VDIRKKPNVIKEKVKKNVIKEKTNQNVDVNLVVNVNADVKELVNVVVTLAKRNIKKEDKLSNII